LTANDDAQVRRFFHDYFEAVEAGGPDGILALVDTDFVIKWPVGEPIMDRECLRAALASLQARVRQEVQWQVVEAHVHDKWAWARVNETAKHFARVGSESRTFKGSHLVILRKDDGRWLLHRDYGSLNELP
jgi:ketosteroid isomerase-like protein